MRLCAVGLMLGLFARPPSCGAWHDSSRAKIPTMLRLPHPIPTADNAEFLVFYLKEHSAGSLLSLTHRRTKAHAWAVIGPRESWECTDHAKAVAKFEELGPEAQLAQR
jgi:hypothetical protein